MLAVLVLLTTAAAPPSASLTVRVTNVRNDKGVVHVDVCSETLFLKDDCPYSSEVPAKAGVTTVTIHGIPAGEYGIQAFQDENRNHKVDRALFGIPKEGVGFSNDAPIHFGPPKWKDARFAVSGRDETVQLKMRYMLGPSGPGAR